MEILRSVLLAFEVVICLLLICIVLIQKSKGGGLGVAFGSGGGDQLFGSRTGNVLTKGTIILASAFLINTVVLAMLSGNTTAAPSLLEQALQSAPAPASQPVAPAGIPNAGITPVELPASAVPTLPGSSFEPAVEPVTPDVPVTATPEPAP